MKLWFHTILFSWAVFDTIFAYQLLAGEHLSTHFLNSISAYTALILIGLSFALSGLAYFWNFADSKVIYRKYLGLSGFALVLTHVIITLTLLQNAFPFPSYYQKQENILSFVFAVYALLIFTMMALISNKSATMQFGGKLWRILLRAGYIAYIFSILHYIPKVYPDWVNWLTEKQQILPPFSLPLTIFAAFVILLRIILWISLMKKPKTSSPPVTTTQNNTD